jgi:Major Facilitator Superfamily
MRLQRTRGPMAARLRSIIRFQRAAIAVLRVGSPATVAGLIVAANGGTEPTMGTRTDEISHLLSIGLTGLGVALGSISISMWITSMFAGSLVDSLGTRKVLSIGACACWLGFSTIGFVLNQAIVELPGLHVRLPLALIAAQFVVGVGFALLDVALYRISTWYEAEQSKEGGSGRLENQRTFAWYAAGSLFGSGVGYLAVWLRVPVSWHLAAFGLAAFSLMMLYAIPRAPDLHGDVRTGKLPRATLPELRRASAVGGAAAFAVVLGFNWSGVLLAREGAAPVIAALGVVVYNAATIVTRVAVDRISARGGVQPVRVVRLCGIGAIGAIALISGPGPGTIATTLAGFAVLGAALGPVNPFVGSVANHLSGDAKGRGIALSQRYVYAGLAVGNAVGPLADAFGHPADGALSLRIAIRALVVLPLLIIVLASNVRSARGTTVLTEPLTESIPVVTLAGSRPAGPAAQLSSPLGPLTAPLAPARVSTAGTAFTVLAGLPPLSHAEWRAWQAIAALGGAVSGPGLLAGPFADLRVLFSRLPWSAVERVLNQLGCATASSLADLDQAVLAIGLTLLSRTHIPRWDDEDLVVGTDEGEFWIGAGGSLVGPSTSFSTDESLLVFAAPWIAGPIGAIADVASSSAVMPFVVEGVLADAEPRSVMPATCGVGIAGVVALLERDTLEQAARGVDPHVPEGCTDAQLAAMVLLGGRALASDVWLVAQVTLHGSAHTVWITPRGAIPNAAMQHRLAAHFDEQLTAD